MHCSIDRHLFSQFCKVKMCVRTSYVCSDCGREESSDFSQCNDKECRGESTETVDVGRCETCLKLYYGSDSDDSDSSDDDDDYKF